MSGGNTSVNIYHKNYMWMDLVSGGNTSVETLNIYHKNYMWMT